MTLVEFESEFGKLGDNYKTKDVDALNRKLLKQGVDVSFLKPIIAEHEEYYRTYFQINILQRKTSEEKLQFVEDNAHLLHDWWHIDSIVSFLGDSMSFDYALSKAKEYVVSDMPYIRRLGYVMFIPRLVRDNSRFEELFALLKNDTEYHVVMGEAWLISYLAMNDWEKTYEYLKNCDLTYDITGKAIQKICDSYVVSAEVKEKYKGLREIRKKYILKK